jgi:hypothetical protein
VGGAETVADSGEQGELLREVLVRGRKTRVLAQLEGAGDGPAGGGEPDLVASRNRPGAVELAAPEDHPLEPRGGRVAQVPDEGVEPRLRRDGLRRVVAALFRSFALWFAPLLLLRREPADEGSLLVEDLELHLIAVLRSFLQEYARAVGLAPNGVADAYIARLPK